MMPKYALIMSANSRLLPGVHAMLNASKYYGFHDRVEFHLLYWPGADTEKFVSDMVASGHYPNFIPINLLEMKEREGPEEQGYKPVYYLKFYRSLYAGRLKNYDAVGFMDADMVITGDLLPYFKLAQEADRILMVGWKYNQGRVDSGWYAKYEVHGTSGCPFDPCVTFFTPARWGHYFEKVHTLGRAVVKRSEMPTMNYMIITEGLLNEIIRLPSIRFTERAWKDVTISWEQPLAGHPYKMLIMEPELPDSRFLCHYRDKTELDWDWHINEWRIDTMLAIHGRWHFRKTLKQKPCQGEGLKRHRAMEQNQNLAHIWTVFKFFNFCCYTRLEPWMPEWGAPNEYIDVESGLLLRDETKEVVV